MFIKRIEIKNFGNQKQCYCFNFENEDKYRPDVDYIMNDDTFIKPVIIIEEDSKDIANMLLFMQLFLGKNVKTSHELFCKHDHLVTIEIEYYIETNNKINYIVHLNSKDIEYEFFTNIVNGMLNRSLDYDKKNSNSRAVYHTLSPAFNNFIYIKVPEFHNESEKRKYIIDADIEMLKEFIRRHGPSIKTEYFNVGLLSVLNALGENVEGVTFNDKTEDIIIKFFNKGKPKTMSVMACTSKFLKIFFVSCYLVESLSAQCTVVIENFESLYNGFPKKDSTAEKLIDLFSYDTQNFHKSQLICIKNKN